LKFESLQAGQSSHNFVFITNSNPALASNLAISISSFGGYAASFNSASSENFASRDKKTPPDHWTGLANPDVKLINLAMRSLIHGAG